MICLNRKALSREVVRAWKYVDVHVKRNFLVSFVLCVCLLYIEMQDLGPSFDM